MPFLCVKTRESVAPKVRRIGPVVSGRRAAFARLIAGGCGEGFCALAFAL
ncbi:MAG: hypothetical protein ACK56I_03155 [bacterium]